jgi:uncharacterized protein (DUF3820 family)
MPETKQAADLCRYCGSPELLTVRCLDGPHYARTHCRSCSRFQRWEAAPMTFERAAKFVLPFGKHQGRELDVIGATDDGLRYLDWLVGQDWLKDNVRRAIKCYLARPAITAELDRAIND